MCFHPYRQRWHHYHGRGGDALTSHHKVRRVSRTEVVLVHQDIHERIRGEEADGDTLLVEHHRDDDVDDEVVEEEDHDDTQREVVGRHFRNRTCEVEEVGLPYCRCPRDYRQWKHFGHRAILKQSRDHQAHLWVHSIEKARPRHSDWEKTYCGFDDA